MPHYYLFALLSCCALLLAGCAGAPAGNSAAEADRGELDGPALYAKYCARCHRPLEKTTKSHRSASRLRSANRQFPAMAKLDFLTDDQLEAIAVALRTIPAAGQQHNSSR